ncbi:MAG: hypothetical protein FJ395_07860 [Verrucomicrobia bacterium]|nr:hypothetical protein [Verrucomicrobiota bacterium]
MQTTILSVLLLATAGITLAAEPIQVSGIYPHLAYFNNEGECGTGAVVPWAGRLWVITYAPHKPKGSSDKLYEITPDLQQIIRPESIGGTPANRMIHRESNQLFIGPYAIDAQRNVRVIPYSKMFGRHTGNARHLADPAGKIYYATMEEGFYEVDVKTLEVKELYQDGNLQKGGLAGTLLPGYHGKGFYSGQGRVVYANNGERSKEALVNPSIPSGCLAEWDGKSPAWHVIRRNQFTEVTGPGGIHGNPNPDTDPIWSVGWDYRSLILMLLDRGQWHAYRLPKASHCYDGAHGWNTEWPRIREIGETDLLMTMHGMFWRFPKTFTAKNSAGIAPRSTYLKVIGDFCRWNDRLVFGCDDTAQSEFLNKRKAKGNIAGPGQSQSNLWFTEPERINRLGTPIGRGAVWFDDPVKAGEPSDPFLFAGFDRRGAHLTADLEGKDGVGRLCESAKAMPIPATRRLTESANNTPVTFTFEVDTKGNGQWKKLREVEVRGYTWIEFPPKEKGTWVRVRANRDCAKATVFFQYSNTPLKRPAPAAAQPATGGLIRARGDNLRTLAFASDAGYYEMGADLKLKRVNDAKAEGYLKKNVAIPKDVLIADAASILYVDESGNRWRIPKGELTGGRICREVCTERDLFNAGGTFYELPANNAGGFAKIRPVATHNLRIHDYCSYRGLLVMSGIEGKARSDDGKVSLWVGVVDDLWQLGKPRGVGGPWKDTVVKAVAPSDPYLMTGYDKKSLTLSADKAVSIRVEIDITGTGLWRIWKTFDVAPGKATEHQFTEAFGAYWVRVVADRDCTASAILTYE